MNSYTDETGTHFNPKLVVVRLTLEEYDEIAAMAEQQERSVQIQLRQMVKQQLQQGTK